MAGPIVNTGIGIAKTMAPQLIDAGLNMATNVLANKAQYVLGDHRIIGGSQLKADVHHTQPNVNELLNHIKAKQSQALNPALDAELERLKKKREDTLDSTRSIRDGFAIGMAASSLGKGGLATFTATSAAFIDGFARGGIKDAVLGAFAAYGGKKMMDNSNIGALGKLMTSAATFGAGKIFEDNIANLFGPTQNKIDAFQNTVSEQQKLSALRQLDTELQNTPKYAVPQDQLKLLNQAKADNFNGMIARETLNKQEPEQVMENNFQYKKDNLPRISM